MKRSPFCALRSSARSVAAVICSELLGSKYQTNNSKSPFSTEETITSGIFWFDGVFSSTNISTNGTASTIGTKMMKNVRTVSYTHLTLPTKA